MANWLDVNPRSGVPIYVQLIEQIKHALEVGILQPGEQLPTVRELSAQLTIAPNTIVKAYDELARMGLITSRPGKGTTVVANLDGTLRKQQMEALFERLHALVRDAAHLDISQEELRRRFDAEVSAFYRESRHEGGQ
jgi:GntR family transcriptional regulator